MTNGGCALSGALMVLTVLRLWTTIEWLRKGNAMTIEMINEMTSELLDEIHPGEILLEEFMKPMHITARQLAADIDVPPSRISDIVNGNRPITADTALRLALFFNMEERFWVNLQAEYDIRIARRTLLAKIAPRIRVFSDATRLADLHP